MDEQDAFSRKKIIFEFNSSYLFLDLAAQKLHKITGIRKPSKFTFVFGIVLFL